MRRRELLAVRKADMGFCDTIVSRAMSFILQLESRRIRDRNKRRSTYTSQDVQCLRRGAIDPDNRVVAHNFLRQCASYLEYLRDKCHTDEKVSSSKYSQGVVNVLTFLPDCSSLRGRDLEREVHSAVGITPAKIRFECIGLLAKRAVRRYSLVATSWFCSRR